MDADNKGAADLYRRYIQGQCTQEERRLVELTALRLHQGNSAQVPGKIRWLPAIRWAAAAAILLLVGGVSFFWFRPVSIHPGSNRATITFADGHRIELDRSQNSVQVSDKNLIYDDGSRVAMPADINSDLTTYNALTTPAGGQYQIILPDGTKVWLNAESTLKYPSSFAGSTRSVELNGEGFFDVSHQQGRPFVVKSHGQEVMVLATSFNINAYDNEENIKTTLVNGSVRVKAVKNEAAVLLAPGYEAIYTEEGELWSQPADVETATAWKNGDFVFDGADIKSIMRQISRWYDVEVVYQGEVSKTSFGGAVPRNHSLQEVLKALETTGKVHFKQSERRITVIP